MGPLPQAAPMALRKKPLMPIWSPLAAEASPAARLAATRAVVPQRTLLIAGGSPSSGPTAGPPPGHVLDQGTVQKLKRYFREFPGASSTRPSMRDRARFACGRPATLPPTPADTSRSRTGLLESNKKGERRTAPLVVVVTEPTIRS